MKTKLFLALILGATLSACDLEFDKGDFSKHVYLNWRSEDTATKIQVNYHTEGAFLESAVYFDTQSRGGVASLYKSKAKGKHYAWPATERVVHHVELTNLVPGKTYFFITGDEKSGFTEERKFKTLNPQAPHFRIANGGDMGSGDDFKKLTELAAKENPDVVLLGGDIAYANGNPSNTLLWDKWLKAWSEKMITPDGYTVPFVLAIGNHETSLVKLLAKKAERAPFYYSLFDQDPSGRSFFTRRLSDDLLVYVLDTAHLYVPFGKQRKWLKKELAANKEVRTKLALYHAGFYPSHRSYYNLHNMLSRISWLPLFDYFKINLALEHHDHSFKRTKYLKNNQVQIEGEGTLYLGDGAWGKGGREVDASKWYLERAEDKIHFWLLDVFEDKISMNAIDETGNIFDSHMLPRLTQKDHELKVAAQGDFKDNIDEVMKEIASNPEYADYMKMYQNE